MKEPKKKETLQWVSAFIPGAVRQIIEKIAADEDRSISQVVRKLLEESPRVKSALRQNGQTKKAA